MTVDGAAANVFLVVPGATTVSGTLDLRPGATGFAGVTGSNGDGSVHVLAGGTFASDGGAANALLDIPITNDAGGTIGVSAPGTVFRFGAQVSNAGTVTVHDGGHLDLGGTTLTDSAFAVTGVTVNAGTGTSSGISGTVAAAGTLAVQTIGAPAPGATFDPLAGPVSGTFAHYSFDQYPYAVTYPAGTVHLTAVRAPGTYVALAPARVLDTRSGFGGSTAGARGTVRVKVLGRGGVPASGVSAVVLNVTVVAPAQLGFLTAYPDGTAVPTASNLNFVAGQTVPNLVVVPVGADGKVALYNGSAGATGVVADVAGYFLSGTPAVSGAFAAVAPARVLDTRSGFGGSAAGARGTARVQVLGRGGVPASGVSAVVLNVTVVAPAQLGFLTAYPDGTAVPTASNLNFVAGQTVPKLVVVPVGADGKVALYNGSAGATGVVADVAGYFRSS